MRWRSRGAVQMAALLLVLAAAGPVAAQEIPVYQPSPYYVKYGKWVLLVATGFLSYQASQEHDKADAAYSNLESYCFDDPARCDLLPNGTYADPITEQFYTTSVHHDDQARKWLFAGEATLLGSAALFVWELTRPKKPPKNIPFEPQITVTGAQTRLGFRVGF